MADALIWMTAGALVLIGLAGTVLPALPGPILVFAGVLLAAWADDFARVGAGTIVLLAIMTALAHLADLASSVLGVRRAGGSRRAVAGAALGVSVGIFFGLAGLIVGPLVGAVLAEWTVRRDVRAAGRAGAAVWIGFLVGTAVKIALVVATLAVGVWSLFL